MARKKPPLKSRKNRKKLQRETIPLAPLHERINLKSVRLIEIHGQLNISDGKLPSPTMTVTAEANFGANIEEKTVVGNLRVTIAPPAPDKPVNEAAPAVSSLGIMAVMQCVFDVDVPPIVASLSEPDQQAVNQLITMIGWPYVRHYVSTLTSGMGIPPFTLPLMRVKLGQPESGQQSAEKKD